MKKLFILTLLFSTAFTCFAQNLVKINECVILNGILKQLEIEYNPATGDRTIVVSGVRKNFYDVYPKKGKDYAEGLTWFVNSDPVVFNGKPYVKYGLPRVLGVIEIKKAGVYKDIGVYMESTLSGTPEVIYIPVRQGCEFQPYQIDCGHVDIEEVNSTATTMQFKAKVGGLTGNMTYNWSLTDGTITSGQGTAAVTVDIKDKKDGDKFTLSLNVTNADNCPVNGYKWVVIKKPGTASVPAASKWGEADRKEFIEACIKNTNMPEQPSRAYCTCMLVKVEKAHPNPATVDKELKQEVVQAWAKECLPKQ